MGIFGDIENAVGDVGKAVGDVGSAVGDAVGDVASFGETAVKDIGHMLGSLASSITGSGLGSVVQELEQLANQANALKQQLQAAVASTHWEGSAADAFKQHAQQREAEVGRLVSALDAAHSAVGAAYAAAGIF